VTAERALRILFVCLGDFHAPPGARQIYHFARGLVGDGHVVRILVGGSSETVQELGENLDERIGVDTYRFRAGRITARTLSDAAAFAPDLVHVYEPRHAPATAALAIARRTRAPLFVRVADDDRYIAEHAGRPTRSWRTAKRALALAGYVSPTAWPFSHPKSHARLVREAVAFDAITPSLARETAKRIGRPCRAILPAAPPPPSPASDGVRASAKLPDDARLLLYAGSVFRPQFADFQLLLRAFALVAAERPDVHLVHTGRLAGRYQRDQLDELVGPGAARLHLLGYLPTEQDVLRLMASADVLVQPGAPTDFNRFRFPAKLHDYLVSGRPVVSFAAGVDEILTDGEHALLTRTGEPAELAAAITRVLDDVGLAEHLGKHGRAWALEAFSPARAARELVDHYLGFLGHVPDFGAEREGQVAFR
jgi:glycosyltransferase involved in cell wall biosynthesis